MRATLINSFRSGLLILLPAAAAACGGYGSDPGPAAIAEDARASELAAAWLADNAASLPALSADTTLLERGVTVDRLRQAHIRYAQFYRGVPVFEGEAIAHIDLARREVMRLTDALVSVPDDIDVTPALSDGDAVLAARDAGGIDLGVPDQTELMIFARDAGARLAYRVRLVGDTERGPIDRVRFVDARTGETLLDYDNLHTIERGAAATGTPATGTAKTLYSGDVGVGTELLSGAYNLKDLTRGELHVTNMDGGTSGSGTIFTSASNVWGNNTSDDAATAGGEALYGAAMTWDFYRSRFERNGIYNDGQGSMSRVHYGTRYNNAFWSNTCKCMTYGDGNGRVLGPLVSLDVAGHEMTHGVTSATAKLTYSGQSGGLNESMSDIFGTMVEFYAVATTPNSPKTPNYWIGEDVYTPSNPDDALRYMDDPRKDGRSIDHYSGYHNGMDVHYSSGLSNHVFYLLSEGGTNRTSGQTVTAIGRDVAAAIFYRALTVYMTASTNFAQARAAMLDAAKDIHGEGSDVVARVASAWSACGVDEQPQPSPSALTRRRTP